VVHRFAMALTDSSRPFRQPLARAFALALALMLGWTATPAQAAETAREVLEDFRAHGYPSPLLALERLQQAEAGPETGDAASLDLRWRVESARAELALQIGDHTTARAAMSHLQSLIDQEYCAPCGTALLLRQSQQAEATGGNELRQHLAALTALPEPTDPELQYQWYMARAAAQDVLGDYEGAIAEALKASETATQHDRPADLAITLSVLASINASRRSTDARASACHARSASGSRSCACWSTTATRWRRRRRTSSARPCSRNFWRWPSRRAGCRRFG
jgi:hypothetical protein